MNSDSPDLPFDPFAARAVGDPWKSPEPDIASINAKPFQQILRLLGQMRHTQQVAALVLGEAGSGKSHLIKRLMSEQTLNLIFVYVHPLKNYRTMSSNLLERVLTNLDCSPLGQSAASEFSQLDLIVANVIVATLEDYSKDGGKVAPQTLRAIRHAPTKVFQFKNKGATWDKILKKSEEFLSRKLSADRISQMVLKCLFQYPDKEKRNAVRSFLSGYVPDDDDAKILGLKFQEIDLTIDAQEERSKQILKTIGRLLSFYRPMILCFDQLENLDTSALVNAFGKLISEIVNEIDNILPVGFMRPDTLESNFSEDRLDKAARDRLTSKVIALEGCNLEQALDMIKARLDWAFEGTSQIRPNAFYPFQEEVLRREIPKDLSTPRSILTTASKLMGNKFAPEDPIVIVRECFHSEREQLLASANKEPFAKDTVTEALSLYFTNQEDKPKYKVIAIDQDSNVGLRLEIRPLANDGENRRLDIWVETATHGKTLIKNLGNLINRIQDEHTDIVIFLRDARSQIPPAAGKMPMTTQKLKEFENCGGIKLYVDYDHLADLCALVYTRNKIPSGDLSYIASDSGDRRPVTMDSFMAFVSAGFRSPFLTDIEKRLLTGKTTRLKPPPGLTPERAREIVDRIKEVLGSPPYMFKLEQIDFNLKKQKNALQITADQLAMLISQHRNVIEQLPVTPPIYRLK